MATQPYLDATRPGVYATPAEWTSLADLWEASAFNAADTAAWIVAGVQMPAAATFLSNRGVTPADAARVKGWIDPLNPPPTAQVLTAIAILSAVAQFNIGVTTQQLQPFILAFFQRATTYGITFGTT